eukprot:560530-Pelagomonas_calceolata.AAC.1
MKQVAMKLNACRDDKEADDNAVGGNEPNKNEADDYEAGDHEENDNEADEVAGDACSALDRSQ